MIEYVDESLIVSGKNNRDVSVSRKKEDQSVEEEEEEEEDDKENHPSQLSFSKSARPTTPTSHLGFENQPNHSTPAPPIHSTPIGVLRPQRPAGAPRSALRPLELEEVSLSNVQPKSKSLLDTALEFSQQSGEEGSEKSFQLPASSQSGKQTVAQLRTAAHAKEQAEMAVLGQGGYWGDKNEVEDFLNQSEDGRVEDEEDPFGFFVNGKTQTGKRKPQEQSEPSKEGKMTHRSNELEASKKSSSTEDLDLAESLAGIERTSSKTSIATQLKPAETPTKEDQENDQDQDQALSDNSSLASLPRVQDLLNPSRVNNPLKETTFQLPEEAQPKGKGRQAKSTTRTPTPSPATSDVQKSTPIPSEHSSRNDAPPSSPIFDFVVPPRDGKKPRAAAAAASTKRKGKASKAKGKSRVGNEDGDRSRLRTDAFIGLLPARGRAVDSLSPPPGSRETKSRASKAKASSKKAKALGKKKTSKTTSKKADSDDDLTSATESGGEGKQVEAGENDESWIGIGGKRISTRQKVRPTPKLAAASKAKSTTSSQAAKKVSPTSNKLTSNSKIKNASSTAPTRSSKRGNTKDMKVMVIIEKSDAESESEGEETMKENVGSSKKRKASKALLVSVWVV